MRRLLLCTSPFRHWPRKSRFAFWARHPPSGLWEIAEPQASTSVVYQDCPPGRIRCEDLLRMVEDARSPQRRRLGKTGLSRAASNYNYLYRSTLRGWSRHLASVAKTRDRKKGWLSNIDAAYLLDLVLEQGGLCAYSGVPMELLKPNSHWRASIERIDNGQGYVKGNCCLIAAEFNSSTQWSKQKVKEVARVRTKEVQLQRLQEDIAVARVRPSLSRTIASRRLHGPDTEGRCPCRHCGMWKWQSQYCKSAASRTGLATVCKQCTRDLESARQQTMRGHGLKLLSNARQRAGKGTWTGSFALDLDDLLDMLWLQGGRCHYSGVPLQCAAGPANWVWSIERLDNSLTYTKDNCVIIAREFQTSDQSRNKARHPVFGTAQWSRRKASHVWGPFSWEDDL